MSYQNHTCTEAGFLKDVADHEMTVIRDDGAYRHLRFKSPGTNCYYFDLITWPGYLCYTGDMGTYVFQRLEDMFEFFRTDREHMTLRDGQTLAINPSYWSEKLKAVDRSGSSGSYEEFSEDRFRAAVIGDLVSWIRDNAYRTTKEERRDLWEAVMAEVLGADSDSGGYRMQCAANDFFHIVKPKVEFYFQDFFEHTVTDYTTRFIWCCYALAWAIAKYDKSKEGGAV